MSAPIRCDLCNMTDPDDPKGETFWTWLTPPNVASPDDVTGDGDFWCEDPEWAVCNVCHRLVLAGSRRVVEARAANNMRNTVGVLMADPMTDKLAMLTMREHLTKVHDAFWTYKTEYRRS